jgi:Fe-S-cluster containining protein
VSTKRLVQRIVNEVRDFQRMLDADSMLQAISNASAVSCRRGCTSCCHTPVSTTVPEALCTLVAARDRGYTLHAREPQDRLRAQLALLTELGTTSTAWGDRRLPCVFLAATGDCAVYAERPTICRTYHVVTPAELCDTRGGIRGIAIVNDRALSMRSFVAMSTLATEMGLLSFGLAPLPVALRLAATLMRDGIAAVNEELRRETMETDHKCCVRWAHLVPRSNNLKETA